MYPYISIKGSVHPPVNRMVHPWIRDAFLKNVFPLMKPREVHKMTRAYLCFGGILASLHRRVCCYCPKYICSREGLTAVCKPIHLGGGDSRRMANTQQLAGLNPQSSSCRASEVTTAPTPLRKSDNWSFNQSLIVR